MGLHCRDRETLPQAIKRCLLSLLASPVTGLSAPMGFSQIAYFVVKQHSIVSLQALSSSWKTIVVAREKILSLPRNFGTLISMHKNLRAPPSAARAFGEAITLPYL